MREIPTPAAVDDEGLRREISQIGFAAISLNGVIGAGIFALPAVAVAAAGLFSPWLILLCGLLIMPVVLAFASAASYFRHTGGPLAYVGHAFGPFAGFQVGWLFTVSRVAATAANANLMLTYAAWLWEPLAAGWVRQLTLIAVLFGLTWLNVLGVRHAIVTVFVFTLLKLVPILILVLLGLTKLNPEVFTAAGLPAFAGLGETILVLLYAFVGFESTGVAAGEARNPRRDIPMALISSVAAVALNYVLVQIVVVSVAPDIGSSERPLLEVAMLLMGVLGAGMITFGAVFSILGNIFSMLISGPRMLYAMGRQQVLPAWFAQVHPRYLTPARSIVFMGVLAAGLAVSEGFVFLAAMSTVVRLIVYSASILALPRLHTALVEGEKPFRLPGGYVIPAIGLLVSLWLIAQAPLNSWWFTGIYALIGTALYFLARRPQSGS